MSEGSIVPISAIYGIRLKTQGHIMKLSKAISDLKRDMEILSKIGSKRVVQYDLKTGKTIAVFMTALKASRAVGLKTSSGIYNTIANRQESSAGFGWRKFK